MDKTDGKVPRWFAAHWAGPAVMAARHGIGFDSVWIAVGPRLDGGILGLEAGPGDLSALIALAGPVAEARTRGWSLGDLRRRRPEAFANLTQALSGIREDIPVPDAESPLAADVRAAFNTPKTWSAVNAVAGALQARKFVGYMEVQEILDRVGAEKQVII